MLGGDVRNNSYYNVTTILPRCLLARLQRAAGHDRVVPGGKRDGEGGGVLVARTVRMGWHTRVRTVTDYWRVAM
jgi:hypothetical protein